MIRSEPGAVQILWGPRAWEGAWIRLFVYDAIGMLSADKWPDLNCGEQGL